VKCPRRSSEKRAERRQRRDTLVVALSTKSDDPTPIPEPSDSLNIEDQHLIQEDESVEHLTVLEPSELIPKFRDFGTQTDLVCLEACNLEELVTKSCDAGVQFPEDVSEIVLLDHMYSVRGEESTKQLHVDEQSEENDSENDEEYDSQFELFSGSDDDQPTDTVIDSNIYIDQEAAMEIILPLTQSSESSQSTEYHMSENEATCSSQSTIDSTHVDERENHCVSLGKQRVFLVFEEQLRELLHFCAKCGSPIIQEDMNEVKNEGSQLTLGMNCINGCSYRWQSQPSLAGTKGAGNLLLSAAIFFSGIHFAKFERFSANANLKTISEDTYTNLRKKYVFPVVKNTWEQEQSTVFEDLKSRDVGIALAGDGRCDSPGHCAKYCTYTLLDVESQKVVDFKVISVSQVTSANVMEIKGFREALQNVEANGVEPSIISTDRHPQIRKEMRVNHVNKDHQFDPWHLAKSVSKKLGLAAKRKDCESLANWIPSIVNHLWWSAMTCDSDAKVLREKWISTIHHVVNRHDWPGNRHYHKCAHEPLDARQERKKIWLEPGSPPHKALVAIVKDKLLIKDIAHLTKCVHTTSLEVSHSMYLKYLPKLTHFSHEVMTYGTMLASLDHNKNANRQQVRFFLNKLYI